MDSFGVSATHRLNTNYETYEAHHPYNPDAHLLWLGFRPRPGEDQQP
jgi:hypothetical protein